jgi:hypothetical protein
MPVLHRMRHIGRLDQVLNHNGGFSVHSILLGLFMAACAIRKGLFPTVVAKCLQILVHNVSGHDRVDNKLTEALPLVVCTENSGAKVVKVAIH